MAVLGFRPPWKDGWIDSLCGKEMPDHVWHQFVRAGDADRRRLYRKAGIQVEKGPVFWFEHKDRRKKYANRHQQPYATATPLPAPEPTKPITPPNDAFNYIAPQIKEAFYKSDAWLHLRAVVLRLGRYRCKHCGASGNQARLHVDHIIPITVDWSRRLDITNLQVLCEYCNMGKSNLFNE